MNQKTILSIIALVILVIIIAYFGSKSFQNDDMTANELMTITDTTTQTPSGDTTTVSPDTSLPTNTPETAQPVAKKPMTGAEYLQQNKSKSDVITTASGLQYKVIKMGTGPKPTAKQTVTVDYEGRLINGTVFDSSYARGESISFPLNGVIAGWTEGLQYMPTGSKFEFTIPSNLAYGERGAGAAIGPNETLIFIVELHSIK